MRTMPGLVTALVIAFWAALVVGQVEIPWSDVWEALVGRLPGGTRTSADAVVWSLRMPRALGAVAIGAGLGAAGVALQGFHRNRLADPYLLGVSGAAGFGAVLGLVVSSSAIVAPVSAAIVAIAYSIQTRRIASSDPGRLVLLGLSLGIGFLAWTVIVVFLADTPRLPTFTYFIFGGLNTITWTTLWPSVIASLGAIGLLQNRWRTVDVLSLGEDQARQLGVPIAQAAALILGAVGLATGAAVALGGVVGFVGLLAPLAAARLVGPSARRSIVASAVIGATIMLATDSLARSVAGPVEVPIGIITAALGAPVLVVMLLRRGRT